HAPAEAAGGTHEEFEEAILAGCQFYRRAAANGLAGEGVESEVGDAEDDGAIVARAAGEGADAGEEFVQFKGFGKVVVSAGIEASDALVDFAAGGEEKDGSGVAAFAKLAQDAQAVATGEHDIENQTVVRRGGDGACDFVAMAADVGGKALGLEGLADEVGGFQLVFDDQDTHEAKANLLAHAVNENFEGAWNHARATAAAAVGGFIGGRGF